VIFSTDAKLYADMLPLPIERPWSAAEDGPTVWETKAYSEGSEFPTERKSYSSCSTSTGDRNAETQNINGQVKCLGKGEMPYKTARQDIGG